MNKQTRQIKLQPAFGHVQNFARAAVHLRQVLGKLGAPATTWAHVFCVHLPEFLEKWGTVYPFLCHGVEGRHRFFKADIHLSCGAQWDRKGTTVGFSHVIRLDRISWALRSFEAAEENKRYKAQRGVLLGTSRAIVRQRLLRCTCFLYLLHVPFLPCFLASLLACSSLEIA